MPHALKHCNLPQGACTVMMFVSRSNEHLSQWGIVAVDAIVYVLFWWFCLVVLDHIIFWRLKTKDYRWQEVRT